MACVCDVAIGVNGIKLGLTETRLGLIPATIGPHVVARMGEAMARRVFMSSRIFEADEAMSLGILARVVSSDALDAAVEAEVTPYLSCAPQAVAEAKALARRLGGQGRSAAREDSIAALVRRWDSDEAREGVSAFLEKRKPDWG
jgi:methylglutaconyl-CoA hydratase